MADLETFSIQRTKDVPLVFDGYLLAEMSSYHDTNQRWSEVRIFKTDSNKWVTEIVGRTTVPGEVVKRRVKVHHIIDSVRSGLERRDRNGTYMTDLSFEALKIAAAQDPLLKTLLEEERI